MDQDKGASGKPDRATHEQSQQAVSAVPVGIPSAEDNRELWRSGPEDYPDIVFVTAGGALGLKADFGRPVIMTIGEWHYLPTKVERLSGFCKSFPRDVASVLAEMSDSEWCRPANVVGDELRLTEARVQEIRRALKVLGFAHCGTLMTDEGAVAGRGYWRSAAGDRFSYALSAAAQGIEARQGGDANAAPSQRDESPVAESDAPVSSPEGTPHAN